jgi:hypothetical protein
LTPAGSSGRGKSALPRSGIGGGIGGDSGGDSGGGSGCRVLATFNEVDTSGTFQPGAFVVGLTFDAVMGAAIMFNGGTAPGNGRPQPARQPEPADGPVRQRLR